MRIQNYREFNINSNASHYRSVDWKCATKSRSLDSSGVVRHDASLAIDDFLGWDDATHYKCSRFSKLFYIIPRQSLDFDLSNEKEKVHLLQLRRLSVDASKIIKDPPKSDSNWYHSTTEQNPNHTASQYDDRNLQTHQYQLLHW